MDVDPQRLGERLAQLRTHRRWSVRSLADVAGVSHQYVRLLEAGKIQRPGLRHLDRLAVALGWPDIHALLASEALAPPAPAPAPALEQAALEAAVERGLLKALAWLARQPDPRSPREQQQLRQLLGDKAEADVAAPLPGVPARNHGGHSTRRRINPELAAA